MNELISIIVPVYKVEPYLEACLNSITGQTYKNLEIILVDDGSPDNCGTICDEFAKKDSRIKVIHQENRGLSEARNSGVNMMTGSYFAFVDSDDIINQKFIETLYSLITKYKTDISMCDFSVFSDEIIPTINAKEKHPTIKIMTEQEFPFILLKDYTESYTVVWNKLYSSNKLNKIRFQKVKGFEDNRYLADYLSVGVSIVSTDEKLCNYRKRLNSLSCKKDLSYIISFINASLYQYDTLKNRYSSTYKQLFYAHILKKISRLATDVYWNLGKEEANQIRSIWSQFYYSDKQYIRDKKEYCKILLYKYFPKLYYILVKHSIYSIINV